MAPPGPHRLTLLIAPLRAVPEKFRKTGTQLVSASFGHYHIMFKLLSQRGCGTFHCKAIGTHLFPTPSITMLLLYAALAIITSAAQILPCNVSTGSGILVGHLHMAKTAGSSFNRLLARRYLGVCGHKGYSCDQPIEDVVRPMTSSRHKGYGRDRVHADVMRERGLHNCALISIEEKWGAWRRVLLNFSNIYKILIVPCRQPLDHLLSMCNYKKKTASKLRGRERLHYVAGEI